MRLRFAGLLVLVATQAQAETEKSLSALSQLIPTTRQECTRRCFTRDADNPKKALSDEKLRQIRAKKKAEADPQKLKQLAADEDEEIERHKDELADMCHYICRNNPEK